jgi:signal transduction histidine kinase
MEEKDRRSIEALTRKDIAEALQFIASSVNRMDSLISSILTLSRVGRRELKPEQLDMRALVQGIINSLAHQIESRGVTVRIGELADLVADRTAVEQIFGNVLDNAVKYLEPRRAGEIEVTGTLHADEAVYHIRDNGRGMDNEDIPKAFEIFRRVGKQDVPGEGMGLAYVKALVRHLGGRIWCESKLGEGSVFTFTIPNGA